MEKKEEEEVTEIKRVVIEAVPHNDQRYNTIGDWFFEQSNAVYDTEKLVIRVSDTGNWKWNMTIALHEFVEAVLCTCDGVTQEQVDEFDTKWQPHDEVEEPGEDPKAPYHLYHTIAVDLETSFWLSMNHEDDWDSYENKLDELMKGYKHER